jgi:hypothetical protein
MSGISGRRCKHFAASVTENKPRNRKHIPENELNS